MVNSQWKFTFEDLNKHITDVEKYVAENVSFQVSLPFQNLFYRAFVVQCALWSKKYKFQLALQLKLPYGQIWHEMQDRLLEECADWIDQKNEVYCRKMSICNNHVFIWSFSEILKLETWSLLGAQDIDTALVVWKSETGIQLIWWNNDSAETIN